MLRLASLLTAAVVIGSAAQVAQTPKPLLVWNVTASAPIGLYRRASGAIAKRDWVLIHAPHDAGELAAQRRYLPRNVPMVKQVAATAGDTVCRTDRRVLVNSVVKAIALDRDHQGRPLPRWSGCQQLHSDQLFLITSPTTSFDSRYFGPVPTNNLIERIVPLWTF